MQEARKTAWWEHVEEGWNLAGKRNMGRQTEGQKSVHRDWDRAKTVSRVRGMEGKESGKKEGPGGAELGESCLSFSFYPKKQWESIGGITGWSEVVRFVERVVSWLEGRREWAWHEEGRSCGLRRAWARVDWVIVWRAEHGKRGSSLTPWAAEWVWGHLLRCRRREGGLPWSLRW